MLIPIHKNFIAGIITLLPIIITYYVVSIVWNICISPIWIHIGPWALLIYNSLPTLLVTFLDNKPLLAQCIMIVAPIFLIVLLITIIGFFMKYILFKRIFSFLTMAIQQIPIVSLLYQTTREVVNIVLSGNEKTFRTVVLVPWGSHAYIIGFLSSNIVQSTTTQNSNSLCAVFIPTAPSPISGFICLYNTNDILLTNIPVEEAFKFIISLGMLNTCIQEHISAIPKTTSNIM